MRTTIVLIMVFAIFFSITAAAHANEIQPTDYSKSEHWLNLPVVIDKNVDVFYLYPTSWTKISPNEANICTIDNPTMFQGAKTAFGKQATVFEPLANIFAPYYRQIDLSPLDREKRVGGIPTADAVAAFDYYIKHYNHGRPFILAGHSQGSNVLSNLLAGYMKEHPDVYSRMIAAYVIGYSVTRPYLAANPHLKFAQGPDDIGVIISYNTEAPDVAPGTNPVTLPEGIAINPISWSRDEALAPAAENLGSLLPVDGFFLPVQHYADARVDKAKGVVICSTADEEKLSPPLPNLKGVYHNCDYLFYYYSLRQNAANRIEKYLLKQSGLKYSIETLSSRLAVQANDGGKPAEPIAVKSGDYFKVVLYAAGGTGYEWMLETKSLKRVEMIDNSVAPVNGTAGLTGGQVKWIFYLRMKAATGQEILQFTLKRPWEQKEPPAQTIALTVKAKQ